MSMSDTEQIPLRVFLMRWLKSLKMEKEMIIGIVSFLEKESQVITMLDYLKEMSDRKIVPTEQQVLRKLAEIVKEEKEQTNIQ